jgi:tetratricopeptide (TPR) repeat protein
MTETPRAAPAPRRTLLACAALLACVAALYGQVVDHELIGYDDPAYFSENAHVTSGLTAESVRWAFTSMRETANWYPLTWLSFMAGVELWGVRPGPHLAVNALLHGANAVLLFLVLTAYTGAFWRSAAVAALFAVHPLRVESVAWLTERKDVLSAFFGLLSLLAYRRYVGAPRRSRLWLTALLLALGLMAKPMLVTAPFVLLLLDGWPLNRLDAGRGGTRDDPRAPARGLLRLLREKVPLLIVVAASSGITFAAQRAAGFRANIEHFTFPERLGNALLSSVRYVGKTILPLNLSVHYPLRHEDLSPAPIAAAAVLLVLGTVLALAAWRRLPYLAVGWLWHLGMLVPVIGLVQFGGQAMADRFTYLPQIGLLLAAVWGGADLASRLRLPRVVPGLCAAAALAALAVVTWNQVGRWRNAGTLFTHALRVQPRTSLALVNLALYHDEQGRYQQALPLYEEALRLNPRHAVGNYNYGNLLIRLGRTDEGIEHLRRSLATDPGYVKALTNLGVALASRGATGEARGFFLQALALEPGSFDTHYNLGILLASEGRWAEAEGAYRKAQAIDPGRTEAHNNLGIVLTSQGRLAEAEAEFRESLRLDPGNHQARRNLEGMERQRASAPRDPGAHNP